MLKFFTIPLQQIIPGQHSLKGNKFIFRQAHTHFIFEIGQHFRKKLGMFHGIADYPVEQEKLQRTGKAGKPTGRKIPGDNPNSRRFLPQLFLTLSLNKL